MTNRYITINTKIKDEPYKRLVHPLIHDLLHKETHNNIQMIFYITDTKYDLFNEKENFNKTTEYKYSIIDLRQTKYQHFLLNGTYSECKCTFVCKTEEIPESDIIKEGCIKKPLNRKIERKNERNIFNSKVYETHNDCLNDMNPKKISIDFLYKKLFEGNSKKLFILLENQFRFLVHHNFFNFEYSSFEKTQYIFEMEHLTTGNFVYLQEFLQSKKNLFKEEKSIKTVKQPMIFFINNEKVLDFTNYLSILKIKVVDNSLINDIFEQIFFNEKLKIHKLSLYSTYEEKNNESKDVFKKNQYNSLADVNELFSVIDDEKVKEFIAFLEIKKDKEIKKNSEMKKLKEKSIFYFLKSLTTKEPHFLLVERFSKFVERELLSVELQEESTEEMKDSIFFYSYLYKKWIYQFNCLLTFLSERESRKIFYIRISDKIKYSFFLDLLNYSKMKQNISFLNSMKVSIIHILEESQMIKNSFIKIAEFDPSNGNTLTTNLISKSLYEKFRDLKISLSSKSTLSYSNNNGSTLSYNNGSTLSNNNKSSLSDKILSKNLYIQDIYTSYSMNILMNITQLIRQVYLSNYFMISTVVWNIDIQKKVEKKVIFNLEDEEFFNNIKRIANQHKQIYSTEDFNLQEIRIPNFLPSELLRNVFTKINNYKRRVQSKKEYKNEICLIFLNEMISFNLIEKNFLLNTTSLLKNNDLYLKNLLNIFIGECLFFNFNNKDKYFYENIKNRVYNKKSLKFNMLEINLIKFIEILEEEKDEEIYIKKYSDTFINKIIDIPILRNNVEILNMRSIEILKKLLKEIILFPFKRYKHLTKKRRFNKQEIENLIFTSKKALQTKISQINVTTENRHIKENKITPRICLCYNRDIKHNKDIKHNNISECNNIIEYNKEDCIFIIHFNENLYEFLQNFAKMVYKEIGGEMFRRKYTFLVEDFTEEEYKFKKKEKVKEIINNQILIQNHKEYEIDLFYMKEIKQICNDDISDIKISEKISIENIEKEEERGHSHCVLYGILKNPYQNPESENMRHVKCIKIRGRELTDIIIYNKHYFNSLNKKNNYDTQFLLIPYLMIYAKKEIIFYREIIKIEKESIQEILRRTEEIEYERKESKEKQDLFLLKSKQTHSSSFLFYVKYYFIFTQTKRQ